MPALVIRPVGRGASVSDWIRVPAIVHADDPHFVREIDIKERMRISRRFNPFFEFGEAELFVAYRDKRPVGRISAQVNRLHRQIHDPGSGHFGFFSCLDDREAAIALFDAAKSWLRSRRSTSIEGPFSFSVNEEAGLLVEGFDEPAAMLMNQARPFMGGLVEAAGLSKVMDTFAFRLRGEPPLRLLARLAGSVTKDPDIVLRPIRVDRFAEEVRAVIDIFNDAWSGNWGFVPFTEPEIVAMIRELKPFYRSEYGCFVEHRGEPVAFLLSIPDVNGIVKPFDGRLLPFNWLRLIRALRGRKHRAARFPLMGIRGRLHGTPMAAGVLALMAQTFMERGRHDHLDWWEFSWVLENNRSMMEFARLLAGPPAKRYRFYRAPL